MPDDPHLKLILRPLKSLRRRLRARLIEEGAAWSLLAAAACVLASLALDYTLRLERPLRAATSLLAVLVLLWTAWRRLVRPASLPMPAADLAQLVERRRPRLGDRLLSAIHFAGSPRPAAESPQMSRRVVAEAADLAASLDLSDIVERRRGLNLLAAGLCAAALLAGLGVWQQDIVSLWARRNLLLQETPWPQRTYLQVQGEDFTLLRGDDLRVEIRADGSCSIPPSVTVHARYPRIGWTQERVEPAAPGATRYVKTFASVTEEFQFYVTGGDDRRDRERPHQVRLIDPPSLVEARFLIEYPAYMQRRPQAIDGSRGVLSAPPTSWVQVEAESTKDLRSAALLMDGEPVGTVSLAHESSAPGLRTILGRFRVPFAPADLDAGRTHDLRIALEDAAGYRDRGEQTFLVEVQRDRPPSAALRKEHVGPAVSPQALVPLAIRAEDDCGVQSATVTLAAGERALKRAEEAIPLADRRGARKLEVAHEIDLRPVGLAPGDTLDLSVRLTDSLPADLGGPNTSRAGPLTFRIISPEELAAELIRRQKALRLEFVEAIVLQESALEQVRLRAESEEDWTAETRRKLAGASREQAAVGAECAKAADAFEAILQEMSYNRLGSDQERRQLDEQVIGPLRDLSEPISRIAATLNQATAREPADALSVLPRVVEAQEQVLTRMNAILAQMQNLENRQDMINALRLIVDWSKKQLEAIEARTTEEAGEIFEP